MILNKVVVNDVDATQPLKNTVKLSKQDKKYNSNNTVLKSNLFMRCTEMPKPLKAQNIFLSKRTDNCHGEKKVINIK